MYSTGADEAKKWILAVAKMMNEDVQSAKTDPNPEKNDQPDEEDSASPFDILEKVRDIVNGELKDPDSNKEIEKLLKKAAEILKDFYEDDEEEEDEARPVTPPQQQNPPNPQDMNQNQSSTGYNPNGGTGDMGAPGSDTATIGGMNVNAGPMGGGQM